MQLLFSDLFLKVLFMPLMLTVLWFCRRPQFMFYTDTKFLYIEGCRFQEFSVKEATVRRLHARGFVFYPNRGNTVNLSHWTRLLTRTTDVVPQSIWGRTFRRNTLMWCIPACSKCLITSSSTSFKWKSSQNISIQPCWSYRALTCQLFPFSRKLAMH